MTKRLQKYCFFLNNANIYPKKVKIVYKSFVLLDIFCIFAGVILYQAIPNRYIMNQLHKIPTLLIRFANEISSAELPLFRGAIISKVPASLTLFHNHLDSGFRYRYPLIQYKRLQDKAAILCMGEGTEAIGSFFASADFDLLIGDRQAHFEIANMQAHQWLLQPWENTFHYTLRHWLPFNSANYATYQQLEGIVARMQMLEWILVGNILSMCTGLGVHIEDEVKCTITQILNEDVYIYKGVKMQGYSIAFSSNMYLPNSIGLGKGVSHGFGVVKQKYIKKHERNS